MECLNQWGGVQQNVGSFVFSVCEHVSLNLGSFDYRGGVAGAFDVLSDHLSLAMG